MKKENKIQTIEVKVLADKALVASDKASERILEIALTAPEKKAVVERAPLNMSLVIDRSGSMDGEKLEYVKQAASHVVDLLGEKDRVAVVIYDDTVEVLVPSTFMGEPAKKDAKNKIAGIRSGGSTNLGGGWLEGCRQVAEASTDKTFNRTLLLTDGLANVGMTSIGELSEHALGLFRRGISTSCFGVGLGYDEHLLEAMAANGGGNFHFLETINAIPLVFEREFLELISVSMRDTEVSLEVPEGVTVNVSGGYQFTKSDRKLKVTLGSLVAGKAYSLFLKLAIKEGLDTSELTIPVAVSARGEDDVEIEGKGQFTFKLAPASEVDAVEPDRPLMERFAPIDLADQATEAMKRERAGDRAGASRMMSDAAFLRKPYVSDNESSKYRFMSEQMAVGMDERTRKRMHQQEYSTKKGRIMTYDYPLRLVKGVLVADIAGLSVVIATGSPISTGVVEDWFFLDQVHKLSKDTLGVTPAYVGKNIGTHVDILLGMDIMKKFHVTVDLKNKRISFSADSPVNMFNNKWVGAERIPFQDLVGTPIIPCLIDGKNVELYLDTGAKLTYLDSMLVKNRTALGIEKDFFYTIGEFETEFYELPVRLGRVQMDLMCGKMPGLMQKLVLGSGKRGVLGTEIFERHGVCLAFPDHELILF